jgi:hypothetical protein
MRGRARHRSDGLRRALALLATLAFAVRALVPVGYMPTPAAAGLPFALEICTSKGLATPADKAPGERGPGDHAPASLCAFAGVVAFDLPTLPALGAPLERDVAAAAPIWSTAPRAAAYRPAGHPRAPPSA